MSVTGDDKFICRYVYCLFTARTENTQNNVIEYMKEWTNKDERKNPIDA